MGRSDGWANRMIAPAPPPVQYEAEGDDKFQHFEINPIKQRGRRSGLDLLRGRRHGLYSFVAPHDQRGPPAAEGCGARRRDDQLLRLRVAGARIARRCRSSPPSPSATRRGARARSWCTSASRATSCARSEAPDANLVLLLDVSGSMDPPDKLPLAVQLDGAAARQPEAHRHRGHRRVRRRGGPGARADAGAATRTRSSRALRSLSARRLDRGRRGHRARLSSSPRRPSARAA